MNLFLRAGDESQQESTASPFIRAEEIAPLCRILNKRIGEMLKKDGVHQRLAKLRQRAARRSVQKCKTA